MISVSAEKQSLACSSISLTIKLLLKFAFIKCPAEMSCSCICICENKCTFESSPCFNNFRRHGVPVANVSLQIVF